MVAIVEIHLAMRLPERSSSRRPERRRPEPRRTTTRRSSRRALVRGTTGALASIGLIVSLTGGCAQILGLDSDARLGSPSGASSSASGAGGGCGDCSPENDCLRGVCTNGACGSTPKAEREPCQGGVCDGAGACVECVVHADCATDHYCDTASHLCVPKKALGTPCGSSSECELDHCTEVDPTNRICCTSDCTGNCESCLEAHTNSPDGTCAPILFGKDPKGGCAGVTCGSGTCDGAGSCGFAPSGTACSTAGCAGSMFDPADACDANGQCNATPPVTCSGNLVCDPMTNACLAACALQQDCVSGYYCAAPFCQMKKAANANCQNNFECLSNVCMISGKCKP